MPTIPMKRKLDILGEKVVKPQMSPTTSDSSAPQIAKPRKMLVGRMKSLPTRKSNRKKVAAVRPNYAAFEETKPNLNNDYCETCKGPGTFLCCDKCPRSFHLTCLNPPMEADSIPENEWHCNLCSPIPLPKDYKADGLFGNLLEVINSSNPVSFEVPEDIKSCFEGVGTNEHGDFVNTTLLVNPKNLLNPLRSGWTRVLELRDKEEIALCYYCRLSGLRGPIICCDYCALYWHLNCLTPPLPIPPPPHLKWRCPNHAEHFLPKARFELPGCNAGQKTKMRLTNGVYDNKAPIDEEDIMTNFLAKTQEIRKLNRFSLLLKEAETEIFGKLLDPLKLVTNQADLMKAFPTAFPSNAWLHTPRPPEILSPIVGHHCTKRDSFNELLETYEGLASPIKIPSEEEGLVEMPRTIFHRLNAIGNLLKPIPREKLLDFLANNSKE